MRAAAFAEERMPESDANLLYQIISSANATVLIPMRGTCDERAAARCPRALKSITDYPWGLPPQALRCHRLRRLKMLSLQFDPLRNEKIWVMTSLKNPAEAGTLNAVFEAVTSLFGCLFTLTPEGSYNN